MYLMKVFKYNQFTRKYLRILEKNLLGMDYLEEYPRNVYHNE